MCCVFPSPLRSSAPAAVVGQPDEDVIEVFVIPHTHDDVGWLLSVDQYFTRNVHCQLSATQVNDWN